MVDFPPGRPALVDDCMIAGDRHIRTRGSIALWLAMAFSAFLPAVPHRPLEADEQPPEAHLAQASEPRSDEEMAEMFFAEGDFFRAITEFRRAIFGCRDQAKIEHLWFRIGDSYLHAGRYNDALKVFDRLAREGTSEGTRPVAKYRLALTHIEAGLAEQSAKHLALCRADPDCVRLAGPDRVDLADAVALFEGRNWEETSRKLRGFGTRYPGSPLTEVAESLEKKADEAKEAPRLSPALAGILSAVIPGLGQFITGRYWDGVQALLFAGGLGAGSGVLFWYEDRSNDPEWVVPSLMAAVAAVFHAANIYGAINAARMTNLMSDFNVISEARTMYRPALRLR